MLIYRLPAVVFVSAPSMFSRSLISHFCFYLVDFLYQLCTRWHLIADCWLWLWMIKSKCTMMKAKVVSFLLFARYQTNINAREKCKSTLDGWLAAASLDWLIWLILITTAQPAVDIGWNGMEWIDNDHRSHAHKTLCEQISYWLTVIRKRIKLCGWAIR